MDERESFIRWTLVGALVVGAAGTVALVLMGRAGWAAAFALGTAVSLGNFHLIAQAVVRVADLDTPKASGHLWKGAVLRFGIVAIVLFLAVVALRLNVLALLAGLLLTQLVMVAYWIVWSLRSVP